VNWDLWVHLFRAELHTATTPEPKVRRAVRAGDVTIALQETRRELYIPCTMTSNNAKWEQGWVYLHNNEPGLPPWTGKVVREKPIPGSTACRLPRAKTGWIQPYKR
jgi:hypothetical protein